MFKGFIFDLDGTIYRNDKLIPGADIVIKPLQEIGRKWNEVYFVIFD